MALTYTTRDARQKGSQSLLTARLLTVYRHAKVLMTSLPPNAGSPGDRLAVRAAIAAAEAVMRKGESDE